MSTADLSDDLTAAELKAIRAGYDRERVYASSRDSLTSRFPPGAPYVLSILDLYYKPGAFRMRPENRERVLISMLASHAALPLDVAIHIYWGIGEGLPLEEILDVLALTGMYGGIHRYSDNLGVLANTVAVLKLAVELKKTDVDSIMGALGAAFSVPQALMLQQARQALGG